MKFNNKNISEDISVIALYDENDSCGETNTTCNDYGCDITINAGKCK